MNLKPCPMCGESARVINRNDFHLSFCIYNPPINKAEDFSKDHTVEHNFLHNRAIQCSNCCLTMPELDPDHPGELELNWNERMLELEIGGAK